MSTERSKRAGIALAAILAITAACGNPDTGTSPFSSPGGRLFLSQCAGCHGPQAGGGVGPPLDAAGHAHHHADTELMQAITDGIVRPGAPTMPAWGGRLSPQQVRQLVDFMKLLWTPEQRAQQQALNPQ